MDLEFWGVVGYISDACVLQWTERSLGKVDRLRFFFLVSWLVRYRSGHN